MSTFRNAAEENYYWYLDHQLLEEPEYEETDSKYLSIRELDDDEYKEIMSS